MLWIQLFYAIITVTNSEFLYPCVVFVCVNMYVYCSTYTYGLQNQYRISKNYQSSAHKKNLRVESWSQK